MSLLRIYGYVEYAIELLFWQCPSEWPLQGLCCSLCRKGSLTQLKSQSMLFKIISSLVVNDRIPCLSHYIWFLKEKKEKPCDWVEKQWGEKREWEIPKKHSTGRIIVKGSKVKSRCQLWMMVLVPWHTVARKADNQSMCTEGQPFIKKLWHINQLTQLLGGWVGIMREKVGQTQAHETAVPCN